MFLLKEGMFFVLRLMVVASLICCVLKSITNTITKAVHIFYMKNSTKLPWDFIITEISNDNFKHLRILKLISLVHFKIKTDYASLVAIIYN